MKKNTKTLAIIYALLAAFLYAVNVPLSKLLMKNINPTMMAAFLYLGAGIGVGIIYIFTYKSENKSDRLKKSDLFYTVGMILLDIAAPIFLMIGIKLGSASNASLLGNFEIVATTVIALLIFKEDVSSKLWSAIFLITISSIILSFEGTLSFKFSIGSIFVIIATCCWGFENNFTRKISDKSTYQIVVLKGIFSGCGAFLISLILEEKLPGITYILLALLVGFVSYGLSIFLYIRAQNILGAAKTSAYYSVAPFVGAFLAFVINGEEITESYFIGLIFMVIGTILVVYDTMKRCHSHLHTHIITQVHNGKKLIYVLRHDHEHAHVLSEARHKHKHNGYIKIDNDKI